MIDKTDNVPGKTKNQELKNPKLYPILFSSAYIIVLAVLSYCQIDEKHTFSVNFFSNIFEVFGHIASFAVLVVVFGALYMEHIKSTIEKGFERIGENVAHGMNKVAHVAEEIRDEWSDNIRKPVSMGNEAKGVAETLTLIESVERNSLIESVERNVAEFVNKGDFKNAEKIWINAINQNPEIKLQLLDKMFLFYTNYDKEIPIEQSINTLSSLESLFTTTSRYYIILANSYMRLKDICPAKAKDGAIKAAFNSIKLDKNNPRCHALLGYVYYWFGDTREAIYHTKEALGIEEKNSNPIDKQEHENIKMFCKNNLSYYYALVREDKDTAHKYADAVIDFYESAENDKKAMSYDGKGFVILRFAEKKEEVEESISYFDKAIRLLPQERVILDHMQEAYIALAKYS